MLRKDAQGEPSFTPQKKKQEKSQSSLQRNVKRTTSINFGTEKIDGTFILNSIGSAFSKNTITLSPTGTNSGPESGALISATNDNEFLIQKGTALVD